MLLQRLMLLQHLILLQSLLLLQHNLSMSTNTSSLLECCLSSFGWILWAVRQGFRDCRDTDCAMKLPSYIAVTTIPRCEKLLLSIDIACKTNNRQDYQS